MKQRITIKQLDELSDFGKGKLRKRTKDFTDDPRDWYDHMVLLSIGQMVEFLVEEVGYPITIHERILDWKVVSRGGNEVYSKGLELCDALWEAVKTVLDN